MAVVHCIEEQIAAGKPVDHIEKLSPSSAFPYIGPGTQYPPVHYSPYDIEDPSTQHLIFAQTMQQQVFRLISLIISFMISFMI